SARTNRSLLKSVTETGADNVTSQTVVNFQYNDSIMPNYTLKSISDLSQAGTQLFAGDFNGDGKTDVATYFSDTGEIKVALSDGINFLPKTSWINTFAKDQKLLLGDFNGDGRADLAAYDPAAGTVRVALSDGTKFVDSGFWVNDPNYGANKEVYAADFSGDGRTDLFMFRPSDRHLRIFINTGKILLFCGEYDPHLGPASAMIIPADVNGDGLADLIGFDQATGNWSVQMNADVFGAYAYYSNVSFSVSNFGAAKLPALADFNHDGRTDIGYFDAANNKIVYRPSIDGGFGPEQTITLNFSLTDPATTQLQTGDFNGDGILDYMVTNNSGKVEIAMSNGKFNDLLTSYDNNHGGKVDIAYGTSADVNNKYLPFAVPVVKNITVSDGIGNTVSSSYTYEGGYWDPAEREYYGFKKATVTDALGNAAVVEYNQDNLYLRGHIDRTAMYDNTGKLLTETRTQWNNDPVISGRDDVRFVTLKRIDSFIYDTPTRGLRTAQEFDYDVALGLLKETRDYGGVDFTTGADTGDDLVRTTVTYNNNVNSGLYGYVATRASYDRNNKLIAQEWNTYDNGADETSPVQKGLLTRKKLWNVVQGKEHDLVYEYTYNDYGAVTKTKDPKNGISEVIYDTTYAMFPLTKHNAQQQEANNTYYGINGVSLSGGIWGALQSTTDANQKKGMYFYDALGRVTSIVSPLDTVIYPTTSYEYVDKPNYRLVISHSRIEHGAPATLDSYSFFDGLGRPIAGKSASVQSGQWVVSGHVVYNSRGEVSKKLLPYFSTKAVTDLELPDATRPGTTYEYDAQGRALKVTYPDGTYSSSTYTSLSNTVYDPNGHKHSSVIDPRGRITMVLEYLGADGRSPDYPNQPYTTYAATRYGYDIQGNLIKVTDAQNNVTDISYDQLGRKVAMKDPDMGVVKYAFDDNGNMSTQTDALGQIKTFNYDNLNRVTKKGQLKGNTIIAPVVYEYDQNPNGVGRLSDVTYGVDKATFNYDDVGQEIKSTKTINGAAYGIQRVYDALGRMKEVTYPDGSKVKYRFDTAGQLNRVKFVQTKTIDGQVWTLSKDIINDIQYAVNGQINQKTLGNGVTITYTYDPLNFRLKELTSTNNSSVVLQHLTYSYDSAGNVTKVIDGVTNITRVMRYDALNRMIHSEGREGAMDYTYDAIGNLVKKGNLVYAYGGKSFYGMITASPSPSPSPNPSGSPAPVIPGPHAVTAISDGTLMSYNANGNMTRLETTADIKLFTYDADNRLIKVEKRSRMNMPTTATIFTYDGDGGRTSKSTVQNVVSPSTGLVISTTQSSTKYVGDLYEETAGGKLDYVFVGGSRAAAWDGAQVRFFLGDHLGSTNVVADEDGAIKERIEFTPWGEKFFIDTPGSTTEKTWAFFTGKMLDEETGLVYFGARYYSPKIGRFITADTIVQSPYNPQTLNRYTYCNNNPVTLIDPTGHSWFKKVFGGGSGTAAAIIGAVVGIVATIALGPAGLAWYGSTMSGIIGGALGGAVSGGLVGGWQGAATGAVIGGVVGGVGGYMSGGSNAASSGGNRLAYTQDLGRIVVNPVMRDAGGSALSDAVGSASAGGWGAAGRAFSGALAGAAGAAAASAASAANYWAYESAVPGPFGQPVSEWRNGAPTSWGDPVGYTERAGGGWMWAERAALGVSAGATIGAIGYDAALPYWRYTGPGSNPNSNWLTRGWNPPYGNNFEAARNALQVRDPITAVERVNVPVFRPVAGPRPAVLHPEYGEGGGAEWYRGIRFPQETGGY
ncbi:MAG: VCBS repeat-containing protein, partial [Candidatus Omnitrophica bacterium]|nr:VCBS repeat-containing protein [Candidatus Omnitrophota bacterium]